MADHEGRLRTSENSLCRVYDVALLDLDGVVYIGADAVPNAAESLARARSEGMRLAFVTNNAARPPAAVAEHLQHLGIPADAAEVVTSSQTAAHYLADRLPAGAPVLVVGTVGLIEALHERGLAPVTSADDQPLAVVQGYSPTADWKMLAEGAIAIRRGALWVATNLDATVPSARGPLPGNGSLVAALRYATGKVPTSTGKPDPTMHRESVERSAAKHPLVVGDRLDTDIEGAAAVGCDSLLVLTGVTTPADLITASPDHRPTYIGRDLRALLVAHRAPVKSIAGYADGGWCVDGQLTLTATNTGADALRAAGADDHDDDAHADDDDIVALRAICAAAWAAADRDGSPLTDGIQAGDAASRAVLARLGLS